MEPALFHMFLVMGDIIDRAFDISVALGLSVGANIIGVVAYVKQQKYYEKRLEQRTQDLIAGSDKLLKVKQDVFETLKDVIHVLDSLENATKEGKTQIIQEIHNAKESINQRIDYIGK